ncbi:hypothetical protein [Domibacillus mangrovi]|uniref:Uncharacterized protein n=1 Tax=Domibacillus mangrovi TaxID=1714354 RepID=A0A1Q5P2J1_9BACI|nr:hypothetical protein [Domibacillus mangrovi]OKL36342.1 hypothetical protein BLL40_10625 [Domibacillus mangrovi]
MAMFRENRELVAPELESLILRIQEENQATNLVFIEQTNHYCVFRGYKNRIEMLFKFDKNCSMGSILEDEIM